MRVMVVGASGAIGSRLVPQPIGRGHEVIRYPSWRQGFVASYGKVSGQQAEDLKTGDLKTGDLGGQEPAG